MDSGTLQEMTNKPQCCQTPSSTWKKLVAKNHDRTRKADLAYVGLSLWSDSPTKIRRISFEFSLKKLTARDLLVNNTVHRNVHANFGAVKRNIVVRIT